MTLTGGAEPRAEQGGSSVPARARKRLRFLPIAALVVHIICIVKGINGDRFLIPGLNDFADKF